MMGLSLFEQEYYDDDDDVNKFNFVEAINISNSYIHILCCKQSHLQTKFTFNDIKFDYKLEIR